MAPPFAKFRTRRPAHICEPRGTARFLSDLHMDALETDWLAEAGGFEPLRIRTRLRRP
jgi:hypothetical protein